ncbi:MAG TPA: phenylalanine--tRNA ligase subunit beta [Lachnospiraceae bacterium]|nr:phenylalanine--tRNA ligase subunit beta [Lachnospiraceae bacterium]
MLAPLSWLKEYVDIDVTPQELQEKLFSCGFEVEELHQTGEEIHDVVVGLVETCEAIPDTHLHVTTVNAGAHGTFQVCCGADNVAAGKKYPLALPGATVYATAKDHVTVEGVMTIKKGKLRGYESCGMLCSGVEIGLNEDLYPGAGYNGLLELPMDAPAGADIKPIVGLDDWLFDIAVTANRPDCQSIFGIAREVAAVLGKELKEPDLSFHPTQMEKDGFRVSVEAPDLCPRYIGHYVYDVTIGPSPAWMRRRLALAGMNAISNIVDITNYVLLELGQPMHAFDEDFIRGGRIVVRRAKKGEVVTTLDEQEYVCNENTLCICDAEGPVALAGVMGGLNSEIRDTTHAVLFESAKFMRDNIRHTSRSLGKRTDASARFEKGVDEYTTVMAMKRALHLTEALGCGKVAKTHCDTNTGNSVDPSPMTVSIEKVNAVLGIEVPTAEILRILKNLGFAPEAEGDQLKLMVPAFRTDIENYPDISEEVIRMYGYDHIRPTMLKTAAVTAGGLTLKQKTVKALKERLCAEGLYEAMHYSFYSPQDLDLMGFEETAPEQKAIRILNPINEDLSILRTTLAPSMLRAIERNEKAGTIDGRLFEIASRFEADALPLTDYPREKETLCAGIWGSKESFFTMKGIADTVAAFLRVSFTYENAQKPFLHPYQCAMIYCGEECVGYLGTVRYELMKTFNLRTKAYLLELDLSRLEKYYGNAVKFTPIPKFPVEKRDLALVMAKEITCAQVEEVIRGACRQVSDVALFDVYEGNPIPQGKRSMAFTVTFTPDEEELTAERIDSFVHKILKMLRKTLDIDLRE